MNDTPPETPIPAKTDPETLVLRGEVPGAWYDSGAGP